MGFIPGACVRNVTKMRCVLLSTGAVLKQKSVGYTKGYLAMQIVETAYSFQTGGVGKITHGSWGTVTQEWTSV